MESSSPTKKSFEVTVFNQKLTLKSEADERYVQNVSDYLNKKIHNIQSNTKTVSSLNVMILAALNITDDFFKLRAKSKKMVQEMEGRVQELIQRIDERMTELKKGF